MTERNACIDGLRDLAEWLEKHPEVAVPVSQSLLLPLHSNDAVERFAAEHGRKSAVDEDGNAFVNFVFGPVTFHVYGYADFERYDAERQEEQARGWADEHGLVLRPATGEAATS